MVVASLLSHAHPADRSTFLTPPAIRHMTKHWGGITVAPKDPHLIKIRWAQEQQAESSNHQGTSVALRDLALAALCAWGLSKSAGHGPPQHQPTTQNVTLFMPSANVLSTLQTLTTSKSGSPYLMSCPPSRSFMESSISGNFSILCTIFFS